jgi:Ras-related protein Rab-5C
MDNWHSEVKS